MSPGIKLYIEEIEAKVDFRMEGLIANNGTAFAVVFLSFFMSLPVFALIFKISAVEQC